MVRLEAADFGDEARLEALARAGGLAPDQFRSHFASLEAHLGGRR